jgi:hypothetical protein
MSPETQDGISRLCLCVSCCAVLCCHGVGLSGPAAKKPQAHSLMRLVKRFLMVAAGRGGSSSVAMQALTTSNGTSALVNLQKSSTQSQLFNTHKAYRV